jgi:hypothetical protein
VLDPDAAWQAFGSATIAALLLSVPSAQLLAARLLRRRGPRPGPTSHPDRH